MNYWLLSILILVSYLIGNINFGKIIASAKKVDLTTKGSGNLGATNMYRNLGAKLGYLTLLLDALKGIVTSLSAYLLFGGSAIFPDGLIALYSCGLASVVGHIFPVFNKFKGGKGISTTIGVFLVAQPLILPIVFACAFILVYFVKYVSLASLLIVSAMTVVQIMTLPVPDLTISLLLFILVILTWYAHRANIERLILGKENETNIAKKLRKDQKQQEKYEYRLERREMRQEVKEDIQELKAEIKQEKRDNKTESKQQRKSLKKEKKENKKDYSKNKKVRRKAKKINRKVKKAEIIAKITQIKETYNLHNKKNEMKKDYK